MLGTRFEPGTPRLQTKYSNYLAGSSVRRSVRDDKCAESGSGVGKIASSVPAVGSNIKSKEF